jgi:cytoskeletal protein CcmA (bactofilin family)
VFGKPKGSDDNDLHAAPGPAPSSMPPVARQPAAAPGSTEAVSSISPGMTIIGKFVGDGVVKVFGRIEGELQAANVMIYDGAQVEGNVVAQDLTIGGRVKGTVHAVRVKLQGTAIVEGDIFHRSLSIEENARFEGTSRREDNLPDVRANPQAKGAGGQAQPQIVPIDGSRKFKGTPDHEDLYQSAD